MPQKSWEMLCELASNEHDPRKMIELMSEINHLLEKERSRRDEKYDVDGPTSRRAAA